MPSIRVCEATANPIMTITAPIITHGLTPVELTFFRPIMDVIPPPASRNRKVRLAS